MSTAKLELITNLLSPVVQEQGASLYDIEFVKEGSDRILRLYIDTDTGVGLEDCERVSRAVEAVLDAHDPIPTAYDLEVSSPGIERKLTRPKHFAKYIGHKIALRLYGPIDGRKKFTGTLASHQDGNITLTEENGTNHHFQQAQIAACKLVVFE